MSNKKKAFKRIKELAKQLPVIKRKQKGKILTTGEELINAGVTEVCSNRIKVHPLDIFEQQGSVYVNVNHEKEMKRIFATKGMDGVEAYCLSVKMYAEQFNKSKNINEHQHPF